MADHATRPRTALLPILTMMIGLIPIDCFGSPVQAQEDPPTVTAIWPAGPMEVRLSFDRSAPEDLARTIIGQGITFQLPGGDPDLDVGRLQIADARWVADRTTLALVTDPHAFPSTYRLEPPEGWSALVADMLSYTLSGVEVGHAIDPEAYLPDRSIWLPTPSIGTLVDLTQRSREHRQAQIWLARPGRWFLQGQLPPLEAAIVVEAVAEIPFEVGADFNLFAEGEPVETSEGSTTYRASLTVEPTGQAIFIEATGLIEDGADGDRDPDVPAITLTARVGDRRLPGSDWLLPWAGAPTSESDASSTEDLPTFDGGDPERGAIVFAGEQAKCAQCHQMGGEGGVIGPALDDIGRRGAGWVYRQIAEPSVRLHPEYVSYTLALDDGQVAVGVVRAQDARTVRVLDTNAEVLTLERERIEELRPSATSIMPVGLLGALSPQEVRDLMAYLLESNIGADEGSKPETSPRR